MPAPWTRGFRVRLVGEIHGSQCINVMHFATNQTISDGPAFDLALQQLAQAVLDCAISTLLPAVTSDYRLIKVDARGIAPSPTDPIEVAAPGGSVGELSPTSVSFAASLAQVRTGGGGRSGRGRIFLPPPGEAQIATSDIDGPTLVLIATFLACLAGKFIGETPSTNYRMGVLSQKTFQNTPGNFDSAFREATALLEVGTVAVMSSRKKGRGA